MKKQHILLVGSGVALLCLIYFFGRTIPLRKKQVTVNTPQTTSKTNINSILASAKTQLTSSQQAYLRQLESAVVRGDVKEQQIKIYRQLAVFWRDSAHLLLPYSYYIGEAAKLENSEKSLTFAAQQFYGGFQKQDEPDLRTWMALQAKELFERALVLNPANDSVKIQLGSCYLFGNISESPMEGIRIIREVAAKNPDNMYAQFTLGMGAMLSGQFDKAIERFLKVAEKEPDNVEARLMLAEAFERMGDKANAIKWYTASKHLIREQEFVKEIDKRINSLKK